MSIITSKEYQALVKQKKQKRVSKGEEAFNLQLSNMRIPYQREVRFHPSRMWRFDFIILPTKIAVEVEGGTWIKGAHSRGKHFEEDCEKYAEAIILGWQVLRFTTKQVTSGYALNCVQRALKAITIAEVM